MSASLAAHVTFFYDESRFLYLAETVRRLKDAGADVFVHTNRDFARDFMSGVHLMRHELNGVHPYFLTRFSRFEMEKQLAANEYGYYMYIEDDIAFGPQNFEYYLKYHEDAKADGSCIGFLRIERDESGKAFFTDLTRAPTGKIVLSGKEFTDCSLERYQGMWLLDKDEMSKFVSMRDLFLFKTNHYPGGISMARENSAIGPLYEMFKRKLVRGEPGCFIHHIPNNYIQSNTFCKICVDDVFCRE